MGITSDGATTNRTMWSMLGVSGKIEKLKKSFNNPFDVSCLVYVFSFSENCEKPFICQEIITSKL